MKLSKRIFSFGNLVNFIKFILNLIKLKDYAKWRK